MAHLEIVVGSSGVRSADKDLKQLTQTAKETEKQQQHMAAVFAEVAAAEEKIAKNAADVTEREAKRASDAVAKRYERDFEALVKSEARREALADKQYERDFAALVAKEDKEAALRKRGEDARSKQLARENEQWNDVLQKAKARDERRVESAAKAAKREEELWNNAIQRAKAGLDGVLPIRPRLEAKLNELLTFNKPGGVAPVSAAPAGADPLAALGGSLMSFAPQLALAATAAATLRKAIGETVEYDNLIARLQSVSGSVGAAREQFDKLEELSDKTIYTENQVTEAFLRLEQFGIKPTEQQLLALANIASATGTSLDQVTEAAAAASVGRLRSLQQLGIKAKQEGDSLQLTFKGVTTTVANSAESITAYLVSIGETDYAGAAGRQLSTMGGAVKQLEDAWGDMFREIGRNAVGEFIATGMRAAADAINATTSAVEALFFAMSQKPEFSGMSAGLAAWSKQAAAWGTEDTSLKQRVEDTLAFIEKGRLSSADRELVAFEQRRKVLEEALAVGVNNGRDNTVFSAALDENKRQYEAGANKGGSAQTAQTAQTVALATIIDKSYAEGVAFLTKQREDLAKQQEQQFATIQAELNKEDDATKASYAERKKFLMQYTGADTEAALAANEVLYEKHLATLAAKQAKEQIELQKRLGGIGVGPQSQTQITERKYAGQRFELAAMQPEIERLQGPLQAEETYAQKSIEIERARAREIAQINRDLAQQSMQNAELIFGSLASAMKNAHGEQSKEYQMMFAAQKAFALATAEVAMLTDMAKANEAGFPANVPLYLKAAAQGAQIIAQLSSASYAGNFDSGGDIPRGSYGNVSERGSAELVLRPSRVQGPATVIGSRDTAALLGGGQSMRQVIVVGAEQAFKGWLGSTPHQQSMVTFVKQNGALIRSVVRG